MEQKVTLVDAEAKVRRCPRAAILALTLDRRTMQQACLVYGVHAEQAKTMHHTREVLAHAARRIRALKWAKKGEHIVVVSGRPLGKSGNTNTIVVHTV